MVELDWATSECPHFKDIHWVQFRSSLKTIKDEEHIAANEAGELQLTTGRAIRKLHSIAPNPLRYVYISDISWLVECQARKASFLVSASSQVVRRSFDAKLIS